MGGCERERDVCARERTGARAHSVNTLVRAAGGCKWPWRVCVWRGGLSRSDGGCLQPMESRIVESSRVSRPARTARDREETRVCLVPRARRTPSSVASTVERRARRPLSSLQSRLVFSFFIIYRLSTPPPNSRRAAGSSLEKAHSLHPGAGTPTKPPHTACTSCRQRRESVRSTPGDRQVVREQAE